jgi:hypothetical protein
VNPVEPRSDTRALVVQTEACDCIKNRIAHLLREFGRGRDEELRKLQYKPPIGDRKWVQDQNVVALATVEGATDESVIGPFERIIGVKFFGPKMLNCCAANIPRYPVAAIGANAPICVVQFAENLPPIRI